MYHIIPRGHSILRDTSNAAYLSTSSISTYTSTLTFNYESLALLFIAYTDDTGAFIQEVSVALNESKKNKIVTFLHPSSSVQHNYNSSCSIINSHMANAWSCDQTSMDQWTELCLCHHKQFSRPMNM